MSSKRRNVLALTLLVVGTFVGAYLIASASPVGALGVLGFAGALRLTAEQLADFEERFRYTVRDIGLCNSALYMGMKCPDLSLVLKNEGTRALDARRLEQLPIREVQRWYWAGCQRFGLPAEARRFLKMALVIVTDDDKAGVL